MILDMTIKSFLLDFAKRFTNKIEKNLNLLNKRVNFGKGFSRIKSEHKILVTN